MQIAEKIALFYASGALVLGSVALAAEITRDGEPVGLATRIMAAFQVAALWPVAVFKCLHR